MGKYRKLTDFQMSDLEGVIMAQEAKEMENSERLAIVETELKQLNKTMTAMNDKLDVWNQSYVPRNEIELKFENRDREIKAINTTLEQMEHNKWSIRNLWPAWLAVALSVIGIIERIWG